MLAENYLYTVKQTIITLIVGLILATTLYFVGETRPEEARNPGSKTSQQDVQLTEATSFDPLADALEFTPQEDSAWFFSHINLLTQPPESLTPKDEPLLNELVEFGADNGFGGVLVLAENQLANLANQLEVWKNSGLTAYGIGQGAKNTDARNWFLQQAEKSFKNALALDTENPTIRLLLAKCYLQTEQSTMAGITLLLDLVEENPGNAQAQMLLARYGIVSGQFDKVLIRTEKVLSLQPDNGEAWLLRAEAQRGLGKTTEAVESLEESLNHISDSVLQKEINALLNSLRES